MSGPPIGPAVNPVVPRNASSSGFNAASGPAIGVQPIPQNTSGNTLMTRGIGTDQPGSGITAQIQHPSNATINYAFVVRRLTAS